MLSNNSKIYINIKDFQNEANLKLSKNARDYYNSGACDEISLNDSRQAYNRYQLLPNVLIDVSKIDISIEIFGERISMPLCIAPAAMQKMAHPDGEIATAKASAK
jgi:isopentenyl diphosphate isomerase/L-lactate dehydrogenase-like FMN-dependent dehydrogenase